VTAHAVPARVEFPALGVDAVLQEFLAAKYAELHRVDPRLRTLASTVWDAVLRGGKRLRPTFGYWGWRGAVGPAAPDGTVLPALAALELLHTFALMHDDVMDAAPTRRGAPSTHAAFTGWHAVNGLAGDGAEFGRSAAILAGDLCLVWADELIATAGLPSDVVVGARRVYDRMRVDAIAGQFLDLLGESSPNQPHGHARQVTRLKTASYTVAGPLRYGAALGGIHDPALWRAYADYGFAIGEAFQHRDDVLDVYGDPVVTGKPVGGDLRRGKPTALLERTRALAGRRERAELDRELARGPLADVARLAVLIRRTGALAWVEETITKQVAAAVRALDAAPIDPDARLALLHLAHAVTRRNA
jgi:geranylgeranyl diphosphate synthase type I